jgi:hypothetical protein
MKRLTLSLLASIALAAPLAFHAPSAMASQQPPVAALSNGPPALAAAPLRDEHLFEEDEMAALAALELQHAELQEQKAGFFGPRIGTIIIVVLLVVLLL